MVRTSTTGIINYIHQLFESKYPYKQMKSDTYEYALVGSSIVAISACIHATERSLYQ